MPFLPTHISKNPLYGYSVFRWAKPHCFTIIEVMYLQYQEDITKGVAILPRIQCKYVFCKLFHRGIELDGA